MTIGPEEISVDASPLIYSAAQLASFYIEEALKGEIGRLEFHIDGPLHVRDKRYLRDVFKNRRDLFIDGDKKHWRQGPKRKGKREEYYLQSAIVLAADALSNYLFNKMGLELFLRMDSRKVRIEKLEINGRIVEHYILNP